MKLNYKIIVNNNYKNPYIIIDEDTGEIIDDAQGYGYKSMQNAERCINFKENSGDYKQLKNEYKQLYNKFPNLSKIESEIQDWLFYSFKDGEEIHKNHAKNKLLKSIRENIPELNELFNNNESLKNYYLKKQI